MCCKRREFHRWWPNAKFTLNTNTKGLSCRHCYIFCKRFKFWLRCHPLISYNCKWPASSCKSFFKSSGNPYCLHVSTAIVYVHLYYSGTIVAWVIKGWECVVTTIHRVPRVLCKDLSVVCIWVNCLLNRVIKHVKYYKKQTVFASLTAPRIWKHVQKFL